jgi:hypothetical protein
VLAKVPKVVTVDDITPWQERLAELADKAASHAAESSQPWLDRALAMPDGLAWALLCASILLLVLHRHAQRPISGLLIGGMLAAAILRDRGPDGVGLASLLPGVLAILTVGAALGFGLALPKIATAVVGAASGALAGGLFMATFTSAPWWFGALSLGLLGLLFFFTGYEGVSVWMPPLLCACGLALSLVRLFATPVWAEQALPLRHVGPFALAVAVLTVLLLGLSFERERRRRLRAKARAEREKADEVRRKEEAAERAYD